MALLQIPLRKDIYDYSFRIELDSIVYIMNIRYNTHMNRWILDLKDSSDAPIIMGLPLLLGTQLLKRYADPRLPPGDLFMYNLEDETADGGIDDLGTNLLMMYMENG